jgi:hypothetical protein
VLYLSVGTIDQLLIVSVVLDSYVELSLCLFEFELNLFDHVDQVLYLLLYFVRCHCINFLDQFEVFSWHGPVRIRKSEF